MINHRITHTAAIALAIAAASAPIASADPTPYRDGYEPIPAAPTKETRQDLRSADTRDYAEGRGTYNAPEVVIVDVPKPVDPAISPGGIDWQDVGIGAGGLLGISLMGLGGALFVVHRRGARELTS
jgi:hypothetical protein